jgi:hypothetical protein
MMIVKADNYTTLWESIVGSHMWEMNRPDSDVDVVVITEAPLMSIIIGDQTRPKDEGKLDPKDFKTWLKLPKTHEVDVMWMEIGQLVNLLKKGNINAIWYTMSPLYADHVHSEWHERLKRIVMDNISVKTWESVRGMTLHTLGDSYRKGNAGENFQQDKKIRVAGRNVRFMESLLEGVMSFRPSKFDDREKILAAVNEIDRRIKEKEYSIKEDIPPIPFNNFLYEFRLRP